MEHTTNSITLRGELEALPEFSHENHGRTFYRFTLLVPRLSGAVDRLPIIAEDRLLEQIDPNGGELLTVTGQVRSHNVRTETGRRLLIFVFAMALRAEDGMPINEVVLEGTLCREPTYRRTPLGREICDAMVAVKRTFHRADYLPCILWGRTAQQIALCGVGDTVQITGRLQSRNYTKLTEEGPQERTAYEISAMSALIPEDFNR